MSADCLFVLRHITDSFKLIESVTNSAKKYGCGVYFNPVNALLCCSQLSLDEDSFIFEPTDAFDTISTELLLSPENFTVNGQKAVLPLYERLLIIQALAEVCLNFANTLEIYISFDNPYLPDFSVYKTTWDKVADILFCEYQKNEIPYAEIPCVCLHIFKTIG